MSTTTTGWLVSCAAVLALLLTGCKPETPAPPLRGTMRMVKMVAQPSDSTRHIAVSHQFSVELANSAVEPAEQKNLSDCLAAGCEVLSSRVERQADGTVQGSISVRIAPERFQAFAEAIAAPPATLVSHSESATDETVAVIDIGKRLDAQTALRERLEGMLKQANGSLGDLVAVEKQLADVQATIESETARRDYLRTLTGTVLVNVDYNGLMQQVGPVDLSPIRAALDRFVREVIVSFGTLISCVAYALPWLPFVGLAAWIGRWLVRRRWN